MKFLKKDKNELETINTEFLEVTLTGSKTLHKLLTDFIENKLKKEELEDVVLCEKKCDTLKEKYFELLFKNKRALPFLVEDRYHIVNMIDKVNGRNEFIARSLRVYPFGSYPDINDDFRKLNDVYLKTIEELINCTIIIEMDFKAAFKLTFRIEELRREARALKFKLLEVIYKKTDNPIRVYIISKLIQFVYDVVAWVEDISDYLRGLIIKYPNK